MRAGTALLEGEKEEVNFHLARLTKSLRRTAAMQKLHHIRRARVPIIKVPSVPLEPLSMPCAFILLGSPLPVSVAPARCELKSPCSG